ncbi:uncharacterized protein AB675_21 [Cyphellophora attinorum]|uniref:gamma-glutamylcyclotransferase n=1 Tax=Cyphellophora attinorum TaxID=1664694 RepID=A0A0N0NHM5_9EURO|nr:uncharacterized protein AB675_21 [Phialophora attinorum]KPI34738.1 hypothetical protein AB675_21 [Phialophora attinorum]
MEDSNAETTPAFSCLYFGYASNLSPRTLQQRCPGSMYVGLAVLPGWKFIISSVGFGNIIRASDDDIVYGNLYFLTQQHEDALDKSEEVPHWHQKLTLDVRMVSKDGSGWQSGQEAPATCYTDTKRTTEGVISKEYIIWMRKAIADGVESGVPADYFRKYVDKFLPEDGLVGKEEDIIMVRTIEHNKEDLQFVPREMLKRES